MFILGTTVVYPTAWQTATIAVPAQARFYVALRNRTSGSQESESRQLVLRLGAASEADPDHVGLLPGMTQQVYALFRR